MVGENPVEPLQKLEFLRRFRPGPVIKAAARNPEQRALPAYGQPRFRRDHRPPLSTREMAGCPARKSHSTCSCPILRVQIVDHLLRSRRRRRLVAARKQLARSFHQLLLPVADHRRMNPKLRRQLRQVFSLKAPPSPLAPPAFAEAGFEFRTVLLPLYAHVSYP